MPFPFPGETVTPQTFGAAPEVPTNSATVTVPLSTNLVVSGDRVFVYEGGPRAQVPTTPKQIVAGVAADLDPTFCGDQGDKVPHVLGVVCSLVEMRYGCRDSDGEGQRHIKYPAPQRDAALTTVKVYRNSPRAQAVMPSETETLLPIMGQLDVLRGVVAILHNLTKSLDRRIVTLENRAEDIIKRGWGVLKPLGEAYAGSVGTMAAPIGDYFSIDAEKARTTIQHKDEAREEGLKEGREEGRKEEREAQKAAGAPAPAASVLINQPASPPAAVLGGTPPAPTPTRRSAQRGL